MLKSPTLFEDKTPDFVACARFWRSSRGNTEGVLKDLPRRGFYNSPSRLRRQDIDKSRSTSRNHRHIAGGRSSARAVAVVDYDFPRLDNPGQLRSSYGLTGNLKIDAGLVVTAAEIRAEGIKLDRRVVKTLKRFGRF